MHRKTTRNLSVVMTVAALAASAAVSAFEKPPFPRTGGYNIGTPFDYNNPSYQASLARQNLTVINDYPGMAPGGQSVESIVQAIKAKNPKILVFAYTDSNEMSATLGSSWNALSSKLDSMKWWLYTDSGMTQKVNSGFGSGFYSINNTLFTPKDSSGNNAIEWITHFFVDSLYKPAPSLDGLFMDNVFWKPRVDGDWNRDGKVDSQNDPTVQSWLRQGYARYFSLAHTLMPGKYQIGNITDWADAPGPLPEYQNMANGGVLEAFIGKSYSYEAWGGWKGMMDRYHKIMGMAAQPKLVIFNQIGDPNDYRSMRYGLGSCLLDDGYYSFSNQSQGYHGVFWFDELDAKLGAASPPPTAAWSQGVWRRDFDNGIVLVNPKGNGAQTVTLDTDYVKIKGVQDPVTNNGQVVRTVTLQDRDGIILMRKTPLKRPKAPQNITAQNN
jgi:hypothetical protein